MMLETGVDDKTGHGFQCEFCSKQNAFLRGKSSTFIGHGSNGYVKLPGGCYSLKMGIHMNRELGISFLTYHAMNQGI
jgi:hypothetical protein